jgi:hypothetical protein
MLWRMLLLTGTVVATACNQDPVVPTYDPGPVSITVIASDTTLTAGDADTIKVVITNNLEVLVRLNYSSNCTLGVTIRNVTNQVVLSQDQDPEDCIRVPTTLTIPALGSVTRTFIWTGGSEFSPPDTPTKLPAGPYFITASISALNYTMFSPSARVVLSSGS